MLKCPSRRQSQGRRLQTNSFHQSTSYFLVSVATGGLTRRSRRHEAVMTLLNIYLYVQRKSEKDNPQTMFWLSHYSKCVSSLYKAKKPIKRWLYLSGFNNVSALSLKLWDVQAQGPAWWGLWKEDGVLSWSGFFDIALPCVTKFWCLKAGLGQQLKLQANCPLSAVLMQLSHQADVLKNYAVSPARNWRFSASSDEKASASTPQSADDFGCVAKDVPLRVLSVGRHVARPTAQTSFLGRFVVPKKESFVVLQWG